MPKEEPQRSCIACRGVKGKHDLIRFVMAPDMTLTPDLQEKLPGRGAYTCMSISCLRLAATKKQFNRAFKEELAGADAENIINLVVTRLEDRIASYIALANKAGKVISGSEQVMAELKHKPSSGVLFVAADISRDSGEKMAYLVSQTGVSLVRMFSKEKLGALIGKEMRSVVLVMPSGFAGPIKIEMEKYRNFFEGVESR